jgi:hypothetical protein
MQQHSARALKLDQGCADVASSSAHQPPSSSAHQPPSRSLPDQVELSFPHAHGPISRSASSAVWNAHFLECKLSGMQTAGLRPCHRPDSLCQAIPGLKDPCTSRQATVGTRWTIHTTAGWSGAELWHSCTLQLSPERAATASLHLHSATLLCVCQSVSLWSELLHSLQMRQSCIFIQLDNQAPHLASSCCHSTLSGRYCV